MERQSFVFYRSFYEAISDLPDADRLACYEALMAYALDGVEPKDKGVVSAIYKSMKPQIDANNRRYINGCKGAQYGKLGGRPKKNNDGVIDKNPIGVTDENPNKTPNDNENVNDNENDNEKINYQLIADMYNDTCVSFPKLTRLSDKRKKAIKARLRNYSVDDLKRAFEMAEQSDFLKGGNGRDWSANFDWLMKDSNIAKVLDGNYKNKSPSGKIEIDSNFRKAMRENEVVDFGI